MGREGEGPEGRGQIVIHMEVDPAERGENGFGAKRMIGNRLPGAAHQFSGNGRRHIAVKFLGNAQVHQVDLGG